MKSAKEESTGYTDTSFMKPSLIYFPIIRTISRIVSKFRSSSHSLATFHESDIPNFRFSMVMVWCDNLPSVGLSPAACSSHSPPRTNVHPPASCFACTIGTIYGIFPNSRPTAHRVGARRSLYPAFSNRRMSSGVPRHGIRHCCLHRRQRHSTGRLPVLRMIRCNAVSSAMHPVGSIQGSSCATVL